MALSGDLRDPEAQVEFPPLSMGPPGGFGCHVFPGATLAQVLPVLQSQWVPAGRGRERGAGVLNDSPAFQPVEVLAWAQLPQYRWGRALWLALVLSFKIFPE